MNNNTATGTTNKFWMVWTMHGASPTVQHQTAKSAKDDASRLAEMHPDERFVVLESVSVFIATINPPQELKCVKSKACF